MRERVPSDGPVSIDLSDKIKEELKKGGGYSVTIFNLRNGGTMLGDDHWVVTKYSEVQSMLRRRPGVFEPLTDEEVRQLVG